MPTRKSSGISKEGDNAPIKLTSALPAWSRGGRSSVDKGRNFEDSVSELYRLLGAAVTQNVMVCQKKVDVLAEFEVPGSSIKHRVIVECKNEQKAVGQNQRVMEFAGLLKIARQTGQADSAEIITKVPWSDQAKGFARESGIRLSTYTEKMSQLIDFTGYLTDLTARFEQTDVNRPSQPPLGAYYVDLSAERATFGTVRSIPVVDSYISQWLQDSTLRQLAILGEFGSGKSSLCLKVGHDLARNYLKNPHEARIPLIVNLREFTKTLKIEALISSFLDEECGVPNPRFKLFKAMNDAGALLLIFDGFDEMAVRVDTDTLESNLHEIEKLACSPLSKVILTTRPEYFTSLDEEKNSLNPKLNLIKTRETEYEPVRILPWNECQIEAFLEKRVPLIGEAKRPWTFYRDQIRSIPTLSDLSQRPVLLDMIVKTLPKMIEDNVTVNLTNLYETYLLEEIKRQKILKKRTLLLTNDARMTLLQHLAVDLYKNAISAVTFTEVLNRIEGEIKPPRHELEAYTRDFLTGSFLIRKKDEYYFSHKSILEYLVARELVNEIKTRRPSVFGCHVLSSVIVDFLVEQRPEISTLWDWIDNTKNKLQRENVYSGGNAATLICAMSPDFFAGKDLAGTYLRDANLSFANLRKTKFTRAFLKNVRLVGAQFFSDEIAEGDLIDVVMSIYFAKEVSHTKTDDVVAGINELIRARLGRLGSRIRIASTNENILIGVVEITARYNREIEMIKNHVQSTLSVNVAMYSNEYEDLVKRYPAVSNLHKQGFRYPDETI